MAIYNKQHEEMPDPTPVEMPIGYEKPESLESMIARMVRAESALAAKGGTMETFEEATDFDDNDEGELVSQFQMTDMQEEYMYAKPYNSQPIDPKKTTEKQTEVPSVQPIEKAKETTVSA